MEAKIFRLSKAKLRRDIFERKTSRNLKSIFDRCDRSSVARRPGVRVGRVG